MDVENLGDAFRVVMDQTGWSGARLARELGTPQPWISMVLSGKRDPGVSRSAELLAKAGWQLQVVPGDEVRRRTFLLAAAGATAGAMVPGTANPYGDPAYVNALTARLVFNEDQMGGMPLRAEAARHVSRAVPVALKSGPDLQAAVSRLCRQSALILHDARKMDQAERAAGMALKLGQLADDAVAQAGAYDVLSLIVAQFQARKGIVYAERGLKVGGVPAADQAVLAARLGRAAALAGETMKARGSLEYALEVAPSASAEVLGNVGIGLTDLGLPQRGEPYLAEAVQLSVSSPFTRSLYVARQTKAAVRARQADAAAHDMLVLAGLAPLVQSPRLGFHIREIRDMTARWDGIPDIRDAREALREVAA